MQQITLLTVQFPYTSFFAPEFAVTPFFSPTQNPPQFFSTKIFT